MAVLEKGTAYKAAPRRGAGLRNIGRGILDIATSPLGALGIDIDPNYEGPNVDKWNKFSQINDSIGKIAGDVGIGVATAGLGSALGAGASAATKGVSAGLIGGITGGLGGLQDSTQPQLTDSSAINTVKYGGTIYGKRGKKYFALGGNLTTPVTNNPVPNKALIIKSKVPRVINGELTTHLVDKFDTLVGQDYGDWGENLQGVNIPKALPTNPDGSINFKAIKNVTHYKDGGLIPRSVENPMMEWKNGGEFMQSSNKINAPELGGYFIKIK